jgi:hypothetical protein
MIRHLRAFARRLVGRSGPVAHPVFCSWCERYRPGLAPRITAWSAVAHSSGICPECNARFRAENGLEPLSSEARP